MTNQELYQIRLDRIKKAIRHEKSDKTPFSPFGDSFFGRLAGKTIGEFARSMEVSHQCLLEGVKWLEYSDAHAGAYAVTPTMGIIFWSRLKVPGRELPEDVLWQIDEMELMTTEDYDKIIKMGVQAFQGEFFATKLNFDFSVFGEIAAKGPAMEQEMRDAGYPSYMGGIISLPVDYLSGARTMKRFLLDTKRMPEKVTEVMDMIFENNLAFLKQSISTAVDPTNVFIAMGRGCPDFYHPKIWEQFVWKYLKKTVEACIEMGIAANYHADSDWERGLPYMLEFPKGTTIFESDGLTDIYKAREIIGDRVCIKGDVQAAKLTLATSDEVYKYSRQLCEDMGPGFILSSGCSIPPNAKPENVKAMVLAAAGK